MGRMDEGEMVTGPRAIPMSLNVASSQSSPAAHFTFSFCDQGMLEISLFVFRGLTLLADPYYSIFVQRSRRTPVDQ